MKKRLCILRRTDILVCRTCLSQNAHSIILSVAKNLNCLVGWRFFATLRMTSINSPGRFIVYREKLYFFSK